MTPEPADLRALVFGDDEFTDICEEVPTVLEHSERLIETLNFNVVDATVNRRDHLITFQGVLSVNDETVQFSEDRVPRIGPGPRQADVRRAVGPLAKASRTRSLAHAASR